MKQPPVRGFRRLAQLFKPSHKRHTAELAALVNNIAPSQLMATGLMQFLETGTAPELYFIQPYRIAAQWGTEKRKTLTMFVQGTSDGLFELHWIHHCPACNGVGGNHQDIDGVPSSDHCALCNLDYVTTLDENIEVTFSVASKYVDYPPDLQSKLMLEMMQEIRETGKFDSREDVATGKDCLTLPLFQKLFGAQILGVDRSLHFKHLPILFTDISGSTEMYERLGDAKAYRAVRHHFDILFRHIESNQGVVVKTIGDAVMATFLRNEDAVRAIAGASKEFPYNDPAEGLNLNIKMGLHSGPCLAVTLNNRMDYFGSTVNLAARVQDAAHGGELVITASSVDSQETKQLLRSVADSVSPEPLRLKGIANPVKVFRIRLRP